MFKRIIIALESIAESLRSLDQRVKDMKEEQTKYMELSQKEALNGPARVKEMFDMIKQLTGGQSDGN